VNQGPPRSKPRRTKALSLLALDELTLSPRFEKGTSSSKRRKDT